VIPNDLPGEKNHPTVWLSLALQQFSYLGGEEAEHVVGACLLY